MEMMKPEHERQGYSAGSSGYRHGCRCPECKASNKGYQRTHRAKAETEKPSQDARTGNGPEGIRNVNSNEPAAIMRDETIPSQIVDALQYQDVVSYVDGGEGWSLTELAMYLQATESVECVIQDEVLYVSVRVVQQDYASMRDDQPMSSIPSEESAVPMLSGIPAKPRIVARAWAPSVPGTPIRRCRVRLSAHHITKPRYLYSVW